MKVAIIGAGLAGAACAYELKRAGATPVIYEAGSMIAPGASGNPMGLYNPRLSAEPSFYTEAFLMALETFGAICHSEPKAKNDNILNWKRCGALHLMTDEKRAKRFRQAVSTWRGVDLQIVSREEASVIAGVSVGHEALWIPDSGTVSPQKLCEAYVRGIDVRLNTPIADVREVEADAVILACGMGVMNFPEAAHLSLRAVRGQITQVKAGAASQKLKTCLCYGGYFSPAVDGVHVLGATFQRWLDHTQIIPEDDGDNLAKLQAVCSELAADLVVTGHRAAVRTTTPGHLPIAGQLREGVYVSTGHGSHGILSSLFAARLIADKLSSRGFSVSEQYVSDLSLAWYG